MNILCVTPFTGSEKLVAMTEDCVLRLVQSMMPVGVHMDVLLVNNAASRRVNMTRLKEVAAVAGPAVGTIDELVLQKNEGFGVGVNKGLDYQLIVKRTPTDMILVFNNDLVFDTDGDEKQWLTSLVEALPTRFTEMRSILSPRTNVTATKEACFWKSENLPPQRIGEVSAYCWLVPRRMISAISDRFGYPLFCPQFSNYGSDDAAAAILRFIYGQTPFQIVHRSWVQHLKAQTANELGIKAGTESLLRDLKKWKRANGLK